MMIRILYAMTMIFIVMCLSGVSISYFWAKRQKYIYPKTTKNISDHTFFFQKIIDSKGKVSGIEALLRKYDKENDRWIFPDDIETFTLREVIFLLNKSFVKISYPTDFIAINISVKQLADPRYEYFIRWVKGECYPMKLRIEFNMDSTRKPGIIMRLRIKKNLLISSKLGVNVILEKIEPTKTYYKGIKWLLPYVHGVKIPLSKFQKKSNKEWLDINVGDWTRIIKKINKEIDVTEIEKLEDLDLANKLDLDNRQGYFIDKPHNER